MKINADLSRRAVVHSETPAWLPSPLPGVERRMLERDEGRFPGGAEYFVLAGSFAEEAGEYARGSWLRLPAGSRHRPVIREGCTCYLKTGHLGS